MVKGQEKRERTPFNFGERGAIDRITTINTDDSTQTRFGNNCSHEFVILIWNNMQYTFICPSI